MSRVFILYDDYRYDTSKAGEFGTPIYLLNEPPRNPFDPQTIVASVEARLENQDFNAHEDFLVLTGNMTFVSVMLATVAASYGVVRMLIFDAQASQYIPRTVTWFTDEEDDEVATATHRNA